MCDIIEVLKKSRCSSGYNLVSLNGMKGCFQIEAKDIDTIFDECKGLHLAEIPPDGLQMFVVDIDNKEKGDKVKSLYTYSSMLNIVKIIRETLTKYGVPQNKLLDCSYLTKPPYVDDKGYVKNGFHLAFHNLFIYKQLHDIVEEELSEKIEGYDEMRGKPWLLYGCCKKKESGYYTLEKVLTHDGKEQEVEDYFLDYEITDKKQNPLEITRENVWKFLPRILSVNPWIYKRKTFYCIPGTYNQIKPQKVFIEKYNSDDEEEEEVNEGDEVLEEVFNKLSIERFEEKKTWLTFTQLIRYYGGSLDLALRQSGRASNYDEKGTTRLYEDGTRNFNVRLSKLKLINCLKEDCPDFDVSKYEWIKVKERKETKEEKKKERKERDEKSCKENLKKLTTLTGNNIVYKSENDMVQGKFINSEIYDNEKAKLVFVKSCLGSGKSFSLCSFIKMVGNYDVILGLTPRRSYARSAVERLKRETGLDFKCYLDIPTRGTEDIEHPYIGIQIESLHRISRDVYEGKRVLVIADEIEAILTQCTSTTNADRHVDNMIALHDILTSAHKLGKIICLDAFMSNRTINFFRDIGVYDTETTEIFNFTRKPDERKMIMHGNYLSLVENIKKCLKAGKKIWIMFTSKKKLNQLLTVLKTEFPNKIVKEYTGDKVSDDLTDIEKSWSEADVVAYTATITVGLDYNKKNEFHKGFVYANPSSKNLIRDVFQGTMRVRHLIDNEVECFLETKTVNCNTTATYPIDISEIKKRVNKSTFYKKVFVEKHDTKMREWSVPFTERTMPEWLLNLFYWNTLEWNMSITHMKELFLEYCNLCNYKIEVEENIDIDALEDLPLEIEFETPYECIPTISLEEFKTIERKRKKGAEKLSEDEFMQRKKYIFDRQIIPESVAEVKSDIWDIYTVKGQGKKFNNLRAEKGLMTATDLDEALSFLLEKRDKGKYLEMSGDTLQKAKFIIEMLQELNLKSTCDYEKVIEREIIERYMEKMNLDEVKTVFKCRKTNGKKDTFKGRMGMMNKMLDAWCMSQFKVNVKKQKMVKGKRVYISNYKLVNRLDTDIYNYLLPTICE
jgi:hypothetical protein